MTTPTTTSWRVERHPLYGGWTCVRLVDGALEIWPQRWMAQGRAEHKADELNSEQEGGR